jgi:hypothetical protein
MSDTNQATTNPELQGVQARQEEEFGFAFCSLPEVPERVLPEGLAPGHLELIHILMTKWVNFTVLHYYFFNQQTDGRNVRFTDGTTKWRSWVGSDEEKEVVRKAFQAWKDVGIGLEFKEVNSRHEAEIRVGFEQGDGAWSFVGRDIIDLDLSVNDRTMNFGWSLTQRPEDIDTAIHEIGHTLGFPHEHQNPHAGIVWDEEAVYAALAKPPNRWSRSTTFWNIIRKISPDEVQGSTWDPNSIMHYPFQAGLIKEPEEFANGVHPEGGISKRDKLWVRTFYPPTTEGEEPARLEPLVSQALALGPGEQSDFTIRPDATRTYTIRTFGESNTVMVLFEEVDGELRHLAADDDSGEDRNAQITVKLFAGRRYVLRIRLYYKTGSGETAVMLF